MTILVTGVLVLFNIFLVKREITQKNYWIPFLWLGVSSLPLVLLSIWPYAALNAQGGLPDRSLDVIRVLAASASPLDYILPSTDHFLVGKWINQIFNRQLWVETTLYIGLINLFFAGIGIWTAKKQNQKPLVIILLIGIAFAWLLSLGTDLFWNGERVLVQIPPYIANLVNRSEMHIPMPGLLLFKYLPFFSKLRVFARFGIYVLLFIFTLSALGLKFVLDHIRKQQAVVVFSMAVLLFVWLDFYPGPYQTTFDIKNRPVDVWLASQPGDGAVIQFPFSQSEDQVQVYATLAHGKPFVGGFFNAFPPQQYLEIKPVMENFPDKASVAMLDELGVKFVLADVNSYTQGQEFIRTCESPGFEVCRYNG